MGESDRLAARERMMAKSALSTASLYRCSIAALCLVAATGVARADSVSDFYKGKTINLIAGFPPGGGYDTYVRILARHYGRFIPGQPTVAASNMPGAGSLAAANQIY